MGLIVGPAARRPAYAYLRQDEDWGVLRDSTLRRDAWDATKYVPLGAGGDAYASFGGELRPTYNRYYEAQGFGPGQGAGYGALLTRSVVHADLHLGRVGPLPGVRLFAQLRDGRAWGQPGPPDPFTRDGPDVQQAFADLAVGPGPRAWVTARFGRQELFFGSGRLVEAREGPNVRLAFDGARAWGRVGGWRLDAFAARPVAARVGAWNDRTAARGYAFGRAFGGVYATGPLAGPRGGTASAGGASSAGPGSGANLDLYYLAYRRDSAVFARGAGRERRQTLGARLWGARRGWDYNVEGAGQWGRFTTAAAAAPIRAGTLASDVGYTLDAAPLRPRLSTRLDVASGDRGAGAGRALGTFNALYPRADYFHDGALIGPANVLNVNAYLALHLGPRVAVTPSSGSFWRASTRDGLYNGLGALALGTAGRDTPARGPGSAGAAGRLFGRQRQLVGEWQADAHLFVKGIYEHIDPGAFLRAALEDVPDAATPAAAARGLHRLSLSATYKF